MKSTNSSDSEIHECSSNIEDVLEDFCSNEANEKIEDETLVAPFISLSNDEIIDDILSERDELIVHSENIELLEVGGGNRSREDGIAAVAQTTDGVITVTVDEHKSVAIVRDSLVEIECSSTLETHPFRESTPVVAFHGIVEDGYELFAGELTQDHE